MNEPTILKWPAIFTGQPERFTVSLGRNKRLPYWIHLKHKHTAESDMCVRGRIWAGGGQGQAWVALLKRDVVTH